MSAASVIQSPDVQDPQNLHDPRSDSKVGPIPTDHRARRGLSPRFALFVVERNDPCCTFMEIQRLIAAYEAVLA